MAPRRLISQDQVDAWDKRLTDAARRAFDAQTVEARKLSSLTAASSNAKKAVAVGALAGVATYGLWNADSWQRYVAQYVEPVASEVEQETIDAAMSAFPAADVWGFAPTGLMTTAIVSTAMASGVAIGGRLNDAGTAADPATALAAVLDTGPDILDGVVGSMAQQAANSAIDQVLGYATQYATTNDAYSSATSTWNTVGDDRVRDAHADDGEGQTVPAGQPFLVGGEELMYPGDPAGSDWNIMNCRCWTTIDGADPSYGDEPATDDASTEAA